MSGEPGGLGHLQALQAEVERLREEEAEPLVRAHAARRLRQAERAAGVNVDGTPFVESAAGRRGSLVDAIDAMCTECIYDEHAAGSRVVQIDLCGCYDCPLWLVRPVRTERLAYSEAVVQEMGISPELAQWHREKPRERPPEALLAG